MMASKKKYDACVRTGEYTNQAGETKARWLNIGAVLQTDNGHCLLLDRTFNPAGIADPENRGTVMVSLFEPKQDGQQRPAPQQSQPDSGLDDMDDSSGIPF